MKDRHRSIVGALLISTAMLLAFQSFASVIAQSKNVEQSIWAGESRGFVIKWTTRDITAATSEHPEERILSLSSFVRKEVARYNAEIWREDARFAAESRRRGETPPPPNPCTYERDFMLLSVVGSIVSFQDHYYASCRYEAHPAGQTRFTAVDLAKPGALNYLSIGESWVRPTRKGKVAKLTDFFSESQILKALVADPYARGLLPDPSDPDFPKTLAELKHAPMFGESEDFLTRFAFHHIENDKVAVRIGFSGPGTCRECLYELGILLPIPKHLKTALEAAESRREGFLMKDSGKIAGGKKTFLVLRTMN